MLARASSSVAPCDQQPGSPGQQTLKPSPVWVKATGYFIVLLSVWRGRAASAREIHHSPWQGGWAPLAQRSCSIASGNTVNRVLLESLRRFQAKVREMWNARRSRTSTQLRNEWNRYVRGWWGYFRLAEARQPVRELEKWARRHIRKCFWLGWHGRRGRLRNLRRLGLTGTALGVATSGRGAWRVAAQPRRLGSTAGCGKPHVRWCGRVAGRNPRHSTRSESLTPHGHSVLAAESRLRPLLCRAHGLFQQPARAMLKL